MAYKILIVDDDKSLSFIMGETLKRHGYEVMLAYSEEECYKVLEKNSFHLIILDINLPDSTGFEICKDLRRKSNVPIIFASARSSVTDKIDGLDIGGDFYLSKPYSMNEMLSVVNALIRRCYSSNTDEEIVSFGNVNINITSRTVEKNGAIVQLSLKEFDLLAYLAKNINKAVGKDKLYCYAIRINSHQSDVDDAIEVARQLDLNLQVISLDIPYHEIKGALLGDDFSRLTKSNLKVRMRMCSLFAFAQEKRGLVLGTDNWDERYVGYFTKYGDGAADVLPIVNLTKAEVREACKLYGVDEKLANRVASAGLFEGQTDEGEMGITYKDLDAYLLGKEIPTEAKMRIDYLHKISDHKRKPIPEPIPFERD